MVHRLRRVAPIVPSDGANDEKKALVSSGGKPFDGGSVGKGSATLSGHCTQHSHNTHTHTTHDDDFTVLTSFCFRILQ